VVPPGVGRTFSVEIDIGIALAKSAMKNQPSLAVRGLIRTSKKISVAAVGMKCA
jgi:hypothetical protein